MADVTDPNRLLPGEQTSVSSGNLEDVKHWVSVYAELVDFKDTLLDEIHNQGEHVSDEGRAELANDEKLLQAEAARLKRRLHYWQGELAERQ